MTANTITPSSAVEDAHLLLELRPQMVTLDLQIIPCLKIEPEAIGRSEVAG